MNRIAHGIVSAIVSSMICSVALAEDPAPASTSSAPVASNVSTSPVAVAPGTVRKMFCLNMAMQCFALSQQPATASSQPGSIRMASLDLRAPDIRRVVSEQTLKEPLPDEYELRQEQEQVEVEGTRPEIYVPGGLMTIPWAVMHPTQAWRIFLPVPSSQAK
jgi:hypothetical protein